MVISLFKINVQHHIALKDGMNLEFHLNRRSNRISSTFLVPIKHRIKYEYSANLNASRILNAVKIS